MEPTVFSQNSFMFVSLFINTDATLYFYIYFVAKHVAIYNNMIATSIVTKLSNENVLKCIYKLGKIISHPYSCHKCKLTPEKITGTCQKPFDILLHA